MATVFRCVASRNKRGKTTAPGYRDAGNEGRSGSLNYTGNGGYNWTSTISDTNGMYLYFYTAWLTPCLANNRAYGFQLRCLSE